MTGFPSLPVNVPSHLGNGRCKDYPGPDFETIQLLIGFIFSFLFTISPLNLATLKPAIPRFHSLFSHNLSHNPFKLEISIWHALNDLYTLSVQVRVCLPWCDFGTKLTA